MGTFIGALRVQNSEGPKQKKMYNESLFFAGAF